jgi:hypothetical protein
MNDKPLTITVNKPVKKPKEEKGCFSEGARSVKERGRCEVLDRENKRLLLLHRKLLNTRESEV